MIDVKEIRAEIRAQKAILRDLERQNNEASTLEEVKAIREKIIEAQSKIDDLVEKLEEAQDQQGQFDPMRSYNIAGASYRMCAGSPIRKSEGGPLAINERMADHVAGNRNLDLGKYVRGMVTGDWTNATEERDAFNTSNLGAVIPDFLSAQIIDQARNTSLFASAGCPVFEMQGNNMTIARVANDPVFGFKAEGAEGIPISFDLDSVELKAKTAYGYAYVSLEAIHSARNLTDILYQVFSSALADCIDKGILYGSENGPDGILNDSSIHSIDSTDYNWNDIIRGVGAVRKSNGQPSVVCMNATTEEYLNTLTDCNGVYMEPPEVLKRLQTVVSNQLAADEAGKSDCLVMDPSAVMIGIQNNINIRMIRDSDECLKRGLVAFQIYMMLDAKAVRPSHIARVKAFPKLPTGEVSA